MKRLALALWLVPSTILAGTSRPLMVSAPDWPPFYIEGRPIGKRGLATEVLSRCSESLKLSYQLVDLPINRMFKAMERGDLDVNIMSFKPDRTKFLVYGKAPVFKNSYVPFVKRGSTIKIKSIASFDNLRVGDYVGIRTSDEFRAYLDKRLAQPDGRVDVVNAADSLVKMLVKGRIDITVAAKTELPFRAQSMGYPPGSIQPLPYVLKSADYFVVISKASPLLRSRPSLVTEFDHCITAMKKDGTYARLARDNGYSD